MGNSISNDVNGIYSEGKDPILENKYITTVEKRTVSWFTIASIFIVSSSVVANTSTKYGSAYSLVFFIFAICILCITAIDYLNDRYELKKLGYDISPRQNYLYYIIVAVIIVISIIVLELLLVGNNNENIPNKHKKYNTKY